MKLTLGQVADWIRAEGVFDTTAEATGYSIDTRTLSAGDLYFAVKGERLDGHDFVETAIHDGAIAAVVSQRWLAPANFDESKLLRVPDDCDDCVLDAMQRLARSVRRHWGKRVIGVTGSAGKTTTKECIAQVLSAKFKVLKTEGNLNNHFGVPLTLLRLEPEDDFAVIEMGMNHAGEITALAHIAEPNWGVVSNVGMAHAEFFADGIDGIARAKKELIGELPADGIAFLNADDERVRTFGSDMGKRAILYGTEETAQVCATDIEEAGLDGSRFTAHASGASEPIHLRLMGHHNVLNALAAISVGLESGIPLATCCRALEYLRPTEKRGSVLEYQGAKLIDDCYNSNPRALESMVTALAKTSATRRIVVAGEMLELGPEGPALHAASGRLMHEQGIDIVLGVRGLASYLVEAATVAGTVAIFFETPELAGAWLRDNLRPGDVVLLKASRGVRLERAFELLKPNP
jgi:UDP-N-acetylmuramoyl-tripeptide--D-alanyl-D-alanine ligase